MGSAFQLSLRPWCTIAGTNQQPTLPLVFLEIARKATQRIPRRTKKKTEILELAKLLNYDLII